MRCPESDLATISDVPYTVACLAICKMPISSESFGYVHREGLAAYYSAKIAAHAKADSYCLAMELARHASCAQQQSTKQRSKNRRQDSQEGSSDLRLAERGTVAGV